METSISIGIDLGTINSVAAMMDNDNQTLLCPAGKTGNKLFPSVIAYDPGKKAIIAGRLAFNRRGTSPEPVMSIKHHMADAAFKATCGPYSLSPAEVSAEILRAIKERMQAYLNHFPEYSGCVVDRAVITVPAYFTPVAREATVQAAEMAGLEVESLLAEPVAAMLYHCFQNKIDDGIFMVYDLGLSSFDFSIVSLREGAPRVLGIARQSCLGSDSFDDVLAHHLLKLLRDPCEGYDLEPSVSHTKEDRLRFERLKLEAESIRKELANKDEFYINLEGIFKDNSGAWVNLSASITRAEFEEMIQPLLMITIEECYLALDEVEENHGVTLDMIDGVLLVGAGVGTPAVSKFIEETFTNPGIPVHTKMPKPVNDEPELSVAYGAAIVATSCSIVSSDIRNEQSQPLLSLCLSESAKLAKNIREQNARKPKCITAETIPLQSILALKPHRQSFDTLAEEVNLPNETSKRGKAAYASDIAYAISLGNQAYENSDQMLLTKTFKNLETIKRLLKPDV